jgi:17beta-estradiol 17-dehydrogenase / very-long-chain 3-oxoacyl-CoA reductase
MGDKVSSGFAILGLITAAKYAWTPMQGFYRHVVRRNNDLKKKYAGEWAIVTGASDGIGEALCYELAAKGYSIVLMARTQEKMEKVAKVCEETHKVKTKII